jgi:hypothetical protein
MEIPPHREWFQNEFLRAILTSVSDVLCSSGCVSEGAEDDPPIRNMLLANIRGLRSDVPGKSGITIGSICIEVAGATGNVGATSITGVTA